MKRHLIPMAIASMLLLAVGCKRTELSSEEAALNGSKQASASLALQTCEGEQVIDFNSLTAGSFPTAVLSSGGISIGISSRHMVTNLPAARVFNSATPIDPASPESEKFWSVDMGTPNQAFGGPGVGASGAVMPYINSVALGHMMIIQDDAFPHIREEHGAPGSYIGFDYSAIPGGRVTATELTVIDIENAEIIIIELYESLAAYNSSAAPLHSVSQQNLGENGVAKIALNNTPGVGFIKVIMNGSMAIDNLKFCTSAPPPPPPPGRCTYTQGYWKNHGPNANGNNDNEWPVSSLMLGAPGTSYSDEQLETILRTPVQNNALLNLAHQLITAKLNLANGASSATISATITAADNLIGTRAIPPFGSGSLSSSQVTMLVETLTMFNEGKLPGGPKHCN